MHGYTLPFATISYNFITVSQLALLPLFICQICLLYWSLLVATCEKFCHSNDFLFIAFAHPLWYSISTVPLLKLLRKLKTCLQDFHEDWPILQNLSYWFHSILNMICNHESFLFYSFLFITHLSMQGQIHFNFILY